MLSAGAAAAVYPLEKFAWYRVVYDEVHELGSYLEAEITADIDAAAAEAAAAAAAIGMGATAGAKEKKGKAGASSAQTPWMLPLRCLEGEVKWGLTGTPLVQRGADIHALGGMLGVHVGSQDATLCRQFVDKYFRSSS